MKFIKLTALLKNNAKLPTHLNVNEILTLNENFEGEFIGENYIINHIPGTIIHFKNVDRSMTVLELIKINDKEN